MSIVSKRKKQSSEKYDVKKLYSLIEACSIIKDINKAALIMQMNIYI